MGEEKETLRHKSVLEKINNAKTSEELKRINSSNISRYIASTICYNGEMLNRSKIRGTIKKLVEKGSFEDEEVYETFLRELFNSFFYITKEEVNEYYNELKKDLKIKNMLIEIQMKNLKLYYMQKENNLKKHNSIMKEIEDSYDINNLPKVGLTLLNQKILKAFNSNDIYNNFKIKDFSLLITNAYLNDFNYAEINNLIFRVCRNKYIPGTYSDDEKRLMSEQILGALMNDETILYTVEEIKAKENRKLEIYKMNHEETMENIKNARRISQLPPKLSISTLTSYLAGNSTIFPNDNRIKSENLKKLTELLLAGHKWEENIVRSEVDSVAYSLYAEHELFVDYLLFDKLSKLPLTYYLVDEINYSLERQKEFIKNQDSNVNVYLVENKKGPSDAGKFYNVYISRVKNLDLNDILPTNIDEIVPPKMDIDSVEWYVQENYDDTFKIAGGIILRSDETIGNVNIFKPNSGNVEVTKEEKQKLDLLEDMKKEITSKREELVKLKEEIDRKQKESAVIDENMISIITDYEEKAIELQNQTMDKISTLKQDVLKKIYKDEDKK